MAGSVKHTYTTTAPNNPAKEISKTRWEAEHAVTGFVPYADATTDVNLGHHSVTLDSIKINTDGTRTAAEGVLAWDAKNKTFAIDLFGDCRNQLGQEEYIPVYNNTGSTLTNGKAVYQVGVNSYEYSPGLFFWYQSVEYGDASVKVKARIIGVLTMDISPGEIGFCTRGGQVNDINTGGWSPGSQLYLSAASAGDLTDTAPTYPNFTTLVARTIRQHATAGSIFIRTQLYPNLNSLEDVSFGSASSNDYSN